jgi:vacuolar protein sorting-associated protein 13A/C
LAFWTGKILIQDAALKHNKINDLFKTNNIPLTIKYSSIRRLSIDVPWSKLSSAPVEIKIDGIFIVLKMNKVKKSEDKP